MDKREQLLDIMAEAAKGETKATLRAQIAALSAELETVKAEYAEFVKQHEREVASLSASIPAEIGGLAKELEDESRRLSGRSLDHGCADSGIAANVADRATSALLSLSAELETVKGERDEAINWNMVVETHGTDQFDDLADAWLALPAIQRTTNAAISTFAKWANDDLMARFKTNQLSMFHLAFVEGCMAGVKAAEAKLTGGEAVAWERLHPTEGWVRVSPEDFQHYREQGQAIRSLYTRPDHTSGEVTEAWPDKAKFQWGDRVTKIKGSSWTGRVVGFYSTGLTPRGYAVESENEPGSVQIYPEAAIRALASGGKP